jgi:thymidylate synthase
MAQYAVLQAMICQATGYKQGYMKHTINDAHIYVNHINPLREQLARDNRGARGRLAVLTKEMNFFEFKPEDFKMIGYKPQSHIPMEVSV